PRRARRPGRRDAHPRHRRGCGLRQGDCAVSAAPRLSHRLGIFARTFPRETPEEVAAAVKQAGFALAHWNFAALGRPTLAEDIDDETFARVRAAFDSAGVAIPSVSVTYNVVHPDKQLRQPQTAAAADLIGRIPS